MPNRCSAVVALHTRVSLDRPIVVTVSVHLLFDLGDRGRVFPLGSSRWRGRFRGRVAVARPPGACATALLRCGLPTRGLAAA